MTAPVTETATATGRVARVTGPVVDVEFPAEAMPEIYFALHVEVDFGAGSEEGETKRTLTLEVEQHLGDNLVRAISMQPTDGLTRGAEVFNTGAPIEVPVGDVTKGHVWNALGEPLDVRRRDLVPVGLDGPAGVMRVQVEDVRGLGSAHRFDVLPSSRRRAASSDAAASSMA